MDILIDFDGTCVAHEFPKAGKTIFLGRYDNELDASVAYQNELNKL